MKKTNFVQSQKIKFTKVGASRSIFHFKQFPSDRTHTTLSFPSNNPPANRRYDASEAKFNLNSEIEYINRIHEEISHSVLKTYSICNLSPSIIPEIQPNRKAFSINNAQTGLLFPPYKRIKNGVFYQKKHE
ncbi:hypothetical protein NPIL_472281 [Nephila pilipes]|uniref:Uncharacterized protein n=1 Tax=Nephila pilipes TaxID=299642 RepID=A0A8X6T606_NEPPI|nr:hypothetical protein NPIL_472281 [Nephila pilipes]